MSAEDLSKALLPCPFCGTHPEDDEFEASSIETPDTFQIECGKCHACWPPITRAQVDEAGSDEKVAEIFNRRTPATGEAQL